MINIADRKMKKLVDISHVPTVLTQPYTSDFKPFLVSKVTLEIAGHEHWVTLSVALFIDVIIISKLCHNGVIMIIIISKHCMVKPKVILKLSYI